MKANIIIANGAITMECNEDSSNGCTPFSVKLSGEEGTDTVIKSFDNESAQTAFVAKMLLVENDDASQEFLSSAFMESVYTDAELCNAGFVP